MSSTAANSGSSETSNRRLPTNPRRRNLLSEHRKRVIRACNACNVRRTKCSGSQPCSQCLAKSRICEYSPEDQKITLSKETYTELRERCLLLQRCLADAVPSEEKRKVLLAKWQKTSSASTGVSSSRTDDEEQDEKGNGRILQDPDGYKRYLGESSGAAFMDRLREFVSSVLPLLPEKTRYPDASADVMFTSLLGKYHTHDSRGLLLPAVDPYYLPDSEEMARMLSAFRFYAQDGVVGSPCGGVYYWGDLFTLENQASKYAQTPASNVDFHILANLNAVLALACQYEPSLAASWETYAGETYFARAKLLLLNPMEDASPTHVRTLCLMGHYLLGLYRRDAAYLYIGLAGRMAMVLGLHKGWMIDGQGVAGEQRKREFWNIYILDRWLSCLMGRPAMIPEEAIGVDLPVDMIDSGIPPAAGLIAHVRLSMIMHEILNNIYGIASTGRSFSETIPLLDAALQKLASWQLEIPVSVQLKGDDETTDRAVLTLHMMYNQLIILCTRPLLFTAAKQEVASKYFTRRRRSRQHSNISHSKSCAEAARRNAQLCRQLLASNQSAALAVLDNHFAFTAAIVLELARLIPDIPVREDEAGIEFLLMYLRQAGEQGNESAQDCAHMVDEFKAVIARLLFNHQTMPIVESLPLSNVEESAGGGLISEERLRILPERRMQMPEFANSSSDMSSLDVNMLSEDQFAAYQELFSWFNDTSF